MKVVESFNARIVKGLDGKYYLPENGLLLRCAKRGQNSREWVDASKRDRAKIEQILEKGQA